MVPFRPFHPLVLAVAQELQRRVDEQLDANPLESLRTILEERPALNVEGHKALAAQINDLMDIAQPADDRMRISLMLFLPHRRGTLFTAAEMLLRDALFFPDPPCVQLGTRLAVQLDAQWPKVVEVIKNMPLPPQPILGADGASLPIGTKHPAAAGPLPENIQQFMRPEQG